MMKRRLIKYLCVIAFTVTASAVIFLSVYSFVTLLKTDRATEVSLEYDTFENMVFDLGDKFSGPHGCELCFFHTEEYSVGYFKL